jgi:hypothetical protein
MKRSEYERRRRALEETFESELAMLRAAHEVRMRSLEELWRADPEEDAPSPALAVPPVPAEPPPQQPPIAEALEEILPRLPEVFDKNDVIRLLGWNPPRASLFRALQDLIYAGRLTLKSYGGGRTSNLYSKEVPDAEAQPQSPG